jgi:F0F1-type ATP synthase membrane subunit b/b'
MVARTLPYRQRDKPKPNEALPSISEEMQRQIEADQKDINKQLRHAQEQLDLTKTYPGRK